MRIGAGLEFTPLEFETLIINQEKCFGNNQNLLRWSLKRSPRRRRAKRDTKLEFTPLEFETEKI